jgi:hypothetical protein
MLTANDFVNINLGSSEAEKNTEKQRIERLVAKLAELPTEARARLTQEFLEIVEQLIRRVQAASMLGYQARRLGIEGSSQTAECLFRLLEDEFLSSRACLVDPSDRGQGMRLQNLSGMKLIFLELLTHAIFVTDYAKGEQVANGIASRVKGSPIAAWMKSLSGRAKKARERGHTLD